MAIPQKGCRRMIKKITYGAPFDTEAVTGAYESWQGELPYFSQEEGRKFSYRMAEEDIVFGPWGKCARNQISAAGFMKANAAMIRTTGRTSVSLRRP